MNATDNQAARAYLAAVREALAGLPADEVADITEELREHLADVVEELGADADAEALVTRLGSPHDYAAELRAAAGLEVPAASAASSGPGFWRRLGRLVVAGAGFGAVAGILLGIVISGYGVHPFVYLGAALAVVAGATTVLLGTGGADIPDELRRVPGAERVAGGYRWLQARPWGPGAIAFVTSLRPAWWAVRALVVGAVVVIAGGGGLAAGVVVAALALLGSVWLGRRSESGTVPRRGRLGVHVLNIAAGLAGIYVLAAITDHGWSTPTEYVGYTDTYPEPGMYDENGEPVTNIFAYGPDGTMLENVRLYDQAGRPLGLPGGEECWEGGYDLEFTQLNPWGANVFPRLSATVDGDTGRCQEPELRPPFGETLPGAPAVTPTPAVATPTPSVTTPAPTGAPTPSPTLAPVPTLTPVVPPLAP